jgi:hypothetical protein
MGVHEWSFILGLVDDDDIDLMICRNKTVGDFSEEKGKLFAFQIPEDVFATANPEILKKLTEQGESGHIDASIDDDFNNGLSREWIKVPI